MSKKVKLDLKGLKVESFVTSLKEEEKAKAKGGWTGGRLCFTWPVICESDTCPDSDYC